MLNDLKKKKSDLWKLWMIRKNDLKKMDTNIRSSLWSYCSATLPRRRWSQSDNFLWNRFVKKKKKNEKFWKIVKFNWRDDSDAISDNRAAVRLTPINPQKSLIFKNCDFDLCNLNLFVFIVYLYTCFVCFIESICGWQCDIWQSFDLVLLCEWSVLTKAFCSSMIANWS